MNNSLVLDLFSGTGSFGLECISRGAAKVYFFENYNSIIRNFKKNIKKLKCEKKKKYLMKMLLIFLKLNEIKNKKLDLIFLDPPYKEENIKIIFRKYS